MPDYDLVYQGKAAVQAYLDNVIGLHPDYQYLIEQCPNCNLIACKITKNGNSVIHWVDTVKKVAPDTGFFEDQTMACVSWCSTYDNIKYDKSIWHELNQLAMWPDDASKTPEKPVCTCDYETVIRFVGCQCGGR